MNPDHLSIALSSVGPALKNHLWQSTVFSLLAAMVALCMQKNHARIRFWIWLAASIKFLIPFSILVTLGSTLATSHQPANRDMAAYVLVYKVSQPFASIPVSNPVALAAKANRLQDLRWLVTYYPILLAAIWVIGFLSVLSVWGVYWRRVSHVIRAATTADEGPELSALQCLHRSGIVKTPVRLVLSASDLGPGIYGIICPILIWPSQVLRRLNEAEIKAIVVHEICHIRRNDNLIAFIHMFVEAIFWFHPLVWWLGSRLELERERACDELVLELTGTPQAYAESILKVCEFCLESPLPCVSGITGADLKKRIMRIMANQVAKKLGVGRKILLAVAGLIALSTPVLAGLLHVTQIRAESQTGDKVADLPKLDMGSIKIQKSMDPFPFPLGASRPAHDGVSYINVSLPVLISEAFGVPAERIENLPEWTQSNWYDIEVDANDVAKLKTLAPEHHWAIMLPLLEDRFDLRFHHENKELLVYSLTVATGGPKLKIANVAQPDRLNSISSSEGVKFEENGSSIAPLVQMLEQQLGCTVVDNTKLTGAYDFILSLPGHMVLRPMGMRVELAGARHEVGGDEQPQDSVSLLSSALQDQLGLRLVAQKQAEDVIVIDRLNEPANN
jgi:bla regulator protein BlaR1